MSSAKSDGNKAIVRECFICADKFNDRRLFVHGKCGHADVCSICILRLRSLGKKNLNCPVCKTDLENVVCCTDSSLTYDSFTIWGETCSPGDFVYDHQSAMFFPSNYYKSVVAALWTKKCPSCAEVKRDLKSLREHVQSSHDLRMCELCLDNRTCFPCEQKIYPVHAYEVHLRKGDKDGSDGHPKCEFCKKRYYDKYELFVHLQKDHFSCHLCKKRDGIDAQHKFYHDYESLEAHFRDSHFLCDDRGCLEKKFVVFNDEIALIKHCRDYHPHSSQSQSRKLLNSFQLVGALHSSKSSNSSSSNSRLTFDAGIGGRVENGEWNMILEESAAVAARRKKRNADKKGSDIATTSDVGATASSGDEVITYEEMPSDYPVLESVGTVGRTILVQNFGSISRNTAVNHENKEDFPSLPNAPPVERKAVKSYATAKKEQKDVLDFGKWGKAKVSKKLTVVKPPVSTEALLTPPVPPAESSPTSLSNEANLTTKEERKKQLALLMAASASAPSSTSPSPKAKPVVESNWQDALLSRENTKKSGKSGKPASNIPFYGESATTNQSSSSSNSVSKPSVKPTPAPVIEAASTSSILSSIAELKDTAPIRIAPAQNGYRNESEDFPSLPAARPSKSSVRETMNWSCPQCTLLNAQNATTCRLCGASKNQFNVVSAVPTPIQAAVSSLNTSESISVAKPAGFEMENDAFPSLGQGKPSQKMGKWKTGKLGK